MSRASRFDSKLQTWVPAEYADAVEALARDQLLDVSACVRQAVVWYLRQHGVAPNAQRPSGHQKPIGADRVSA
jgi:hypothetical protein